MVLIIIASDSVNEVMAIHPATLHANAKCSAKLSYYQLQRSVSRKQIELLDI